MEAKRKRTASSEREFERTEAGRTTTIHRECNYEVYTDGFIEPPDRLDLARARIS